MTFSGVNVQVSSIVCRNNASMIESNHSDTFGGNDFMGKGFWHEFLRLHAN